MKIDINYEGGYSTDKGWDLKINDQKINSNKWKKEKLIKVITQLIEVIEED